MIIREAKVIDATSIARVDVDGWRTTYTGIVPQDYLNSRSYERRASVWQTRIADSANLRPGWFIYVAEVDDGSIIGFAGGGSKHGENQGFSGELGFIYLLRFHQRQGIGRQLLATVALRLKQQGHNSMLVWVLAANPYRSFYAVLEGQPAAERQVIIGGANLVEIAYGWRDLGIFAEMQKLGIMRSTLSIDSGQ